MICFLVYVRIKELILRILRWICICFSLIFYFVLYSRSIECAIIVYCQTNCLCCSLFLKCRSNTRRVLLISNKIRRRWSLHIYRYEYKNGKRMIHYEGSEFNNFFFFDDKFIKKKFYILDWIRKKSSFLVSILLQLNI